MKTQTKHQIEIARCIKAARTAIRLKHSLAADEECAKKLPGLQRELDNALNKGKAFRLKLAEYLET